MDYFSPLTSQIPRWRSFLVAAAITFPSLIFSQTYKGSQLQHSGGGISAFGDTLVIWGTGKGITVSANTPEQFTNGVYEISIESRPRLTGNPPEFPILSVSMSQGLEQAKFTVESHLTKKVQLNGAGNVIVSFINDDYIENVYDINVDIIKVTVEKISEIIDTLRVPLTVFWLPNMEFDLESYRIFYGNQQGVYQDTVLAGKGDTSKIFVTFGTGDFWLAMTAIDTAGNESGFSHEIHFYVTDDSIEIEYDMDENGVVDFFDLIKLLRAFGEPQRYFAKGDFDNNGEIDSLDLIRFLRFSKLF